MKKVNKVTQENNGMGQVLQMYAKDIALKTRYCVLSGLATGNINPFEIDKVANKFITFQGYLNVRYDSQKGMEYIMRGKNPVEICKSGHYIEWANVVYEFKNMVDAFQSEKYTNPVNFNCFIEKRTSDYKSMAALYALLGEECYSRITFEEIFEKGCSVENVERYLQENYPVGSYLYDLKTNIFEVNFEMNAKAFNKVHRREIANKSYKNKLKCSPIRNPYTQEKIGFFSTDAHGLEITLFESFGKVVYSWKEIAETLVENDFYRFSTLELPQLPVVESEFCMKAKEVVQKVKTVVTNFVEVQGTKKTVVGQLSLF